MAETLTDEEMMALEEEELGGKKPALAQAQQPSEDIMTDEEMARAEEDEAPSLIGELAAGAGGAVLNGVEWVGKAFDSIGGAPTRGALDALVDGNNPIKGFTNNFLTPTEAVPTGEGIAQKAGLSSDPLVQMTDEEYQHLEDTDPLAARDIRGLRAMSPSGVAGVAIDTLADWTNIFPGKVALKLFGKGAAWTGKKLLKGSVDVADAAVGGGKIQKVTDAVGSSLESIKSYFNPTRADDYPEMLDIAQRNGINPDDLPEAIEFGPHSLITRRTRVQAEGPTGQHLLERHDRFLEQVRKAAEGKIAKIGGGIVRKADEAGHFLKEIYDKRLGEFLESVDITYGFVAKKYPGLKISEQASQKLAVRTSQIEQRAIRLIENASTRTEVTQGKQILRALENLKKKGGDYAAITELMQSVGRNSFKVSNTLADIPPDTRTFREIYRALSDALVETAEHTAGKDVGAMLRESNKKLHKVFGDKSVLAKELGNPNIGTEKIFERIVMSGDTRKLEALKFLLKSEDLKGLKGAILEQLAKRNEDGALVFKQYRRNLRQKRDTLLAQIFSPDELGELDEILRLGDAAGLPIMSTSGTGASHALMDIGKGVTNSVTDSALVAGLKERARTGAPLVREVNPAAKGPSSFAPKPALPPSQKLKNALMPTKLGKLAKAAQVAGVSIAGPEMVEGFMVSDLEDVTPMQLNAVKQNIQNSDLSNTEKARVLNLINKHGKIPLQYMPY